jgi:hypothetical protein
VKYACLLALFDNVDWLYRVMPFLDPNVLTAVSTKVQESSELLVALRDVGPSWRRGGDVPLLSASRIYSFLDKNKAILGIDRFLIGLDEQLNTDVVRIKLLLTALMVDFFAGNFETAPAPVRELLVIFGGIPIRTSDGSTYLVYSEESEPAYLRANGGGCRLCLSEDAFVTRFFPNHRCQAYAAISQAVTQGGHGFPGKHPWTSLATRELPPDLLRIVPRELQSLPLWMASTRPGPLRYRGLQWIFRELRYVDDIPMNLQRAAELGDCLKDASLLSVEALTLLERFDPDGIHGKLQIWLDRSNSTSEIGAIVDFAERRRMSLTCPNLNPLIEESFDADKWGLLRQWWQLVKRYKLPGDLTQFLCDRITKLTLHQVKSVLESELVANKMAVVQAGILRGASLNVLVPLARSLSFNEYREIVRSSVKNKRFDLAIELWTLDLGLHEELLECLAFAKSSKDPYIAEAVPALEFMAASYGLAVSGSESNRSA